MHYASAQNQTQAKRQNTGRDNDYGYTPSGHTALKQHAGTMNFTEAAQTLSPRNGNPLSPRNAVQRKDTNRSCRRTPSLTPGRNYTVRGDTSIGSGTFHIAVCSNFRGRVCGQELARDGSFTGRLIEADTTDIVSARRFVARPVKGSRKKSRKSAPKKPAKTTDKQATEPENREEEESAADVQTQVIGLLDRVAGKLKATKAYHLANTRGMGLVYAPILDEMTTPLEAEELWLQFNTLDTDTAQSMRAILKSILSMYHTNPYGIVSGLFHLWKLRRYPNYTTIKREYKGYGKRLFLYLNPTWKSPAQIEKEEQEQRRQREKVAKADRARKKLKAQIPQIAHAYEQGAIGLVKENRHGDAAKVRSQKAAHLARMKEMADEELSFGAGTVGVISDGVGLVNDIGELTAPKSGPSAGGVLKKAGTVLAVVATTWEVTEALANNDGKRAAACLTKTAVQLGLASAGPVGIVILVGWVAVDLVIAVVEAGQNVKPDNGPRNIAAAHNIYNRLMAIHGDDRQKVTRIIDEWTSYLGFGGHTKDKPGMAEGIPFYKCYKVMPDGRQSWKTFNPYTSSRYKRKKIMYTRSWKVPPRVDLSY